MRWKTPDFNDHPLIQKPEFIDEIHDSSSDSKPIAELLLRFLNFEEPFVPEMHLFDTAHLMPQ